LPIDVIKARQTLIEKRDELEKLSNMSADARHTVALDQQSVGRLSRMDAIQQQAMAQATERKRVTDIAKIDAALHRLDEGDYGYCDECGEEIPDDRLAVDPAASLCVKCAKQLTA
jgi:DnaK suppressor protein